MGANRNPNRFFRGDVGTAVRDTKSGTVTYGTSGGKVTQQQAEAVTEIQRKAQARSSNNVYVPLEGYTVTQPQTGTQITAQAGGQEVTITKTTNVEKQREEKQRLENQRTVQQINNNIITELKDKPAPNQDVRNTYLNPNPSPSSYGAVQKAEQGIAQQKEYERIKKQVVNYKFNSPTPNNFKSNDVVLKPAKNTTPIVVPQTTVYVDADTKKTLLVLAPDKDLNKEPTTPKYERNPVENFLEGGAGFIVEGTVSAAKGVYKVEKAAVKGFMWAEQDNPVNLIYDKDVQSAAFVGALAFATPYIAVPVMATFSGVSWYNAIESGSAQDYGAAAVSTLFTFSPLVNKGIPQKVQTKTPTGKATQFVEVDVLPTGKAGTFKTVRASKLNVEVETKTVWTKDIPKTSKQPLNYEYVTKGKQIEARTDGGSNVYAGSGVGKAKINPKTGEVQIIKQDVTSNLAYSTTKDIVKPYDVVKNLEKPLPRTETPTVSVKQYSRVNKGKVYYEGTRLEKGFDLVISKKLNKDVTIEKNLANAKNDNTANSDALGQFSPRSKGITINEKNIIETGDATGKFSKEGTAAHEYGHLLDDRSGYEFIGAKQKRTTSRGKPSTDYFTASGKRIPKKEVKAMIRAQKTYEGLGYTVEERPYELNADIIRAIITKDKDFLNRMQRKAPTILNEYTKAVRKEGIPENAEFSLRDTQRVISEKIFDKPVTQQVKSYTRLGKTKKIETEQFNKQDVNTYVGEDVARSSIGVIDYKQVKRPYVRKSKIETNKIQRLTDQQKTVKDAMNRLNAPEKQAQPIEVSSSNGVVLVQESAPIQTVQKPIINKPSQVKTIYNPNEQSFNVIGNQRIPSNLEQPRYTEVFFPTRTEIPKDIYKPIDTTDIKTDNERIPIIRPKQEQQPKPDNRQRIDIFQENKPAEDIKPVVDITPVQDVTPIQEVEPIQRTDNTFDFVEIQKTKKPKPSFLNIPTGGKDKNNIAGSPLFVRRRGKFNFIGSFQTPELAYEKGRKIVRETAAASFKIGGRVNKLFDTDILPSTREANVYIQKREKRISSAGEKVEITQKGWLSQGVKKQFRWF